MGDFTSMLLMYSHINNHVGLNNRPAIVHDYRTASKYSPTLK